jgi:hypothetical protein
MRKRSPPTSFPTSPTMRRRALKGEVIGMFTGNFSSNAAGLAVPSNIHQGRCGEAAKVWRH